MTTIIQYNLSNIQSIYEKNEYELLDNVKEVFSYLDKLIPDEQIHQIPLTRNERSYDRNHKHRNRRNRGGMNRGYSSTNDMDNWEAIRDFKPTEKKEVIGLDKEINELRSFLNKISKANYETQRELIVEKINSLFNKENMDTDDVNKVVDCVFDTCSTSKFLSELYADLYVELVGHHDNFGNKLDNFVTTFKESLNNIKYVNPDEDYDGFCNYNLINESRKANSMFIVNLMIRDMISQSEFIDLLKMMQETSLDYIDKENRVHEVEEITENVFLLVTHSKELLGTQDLWTPIKDHISHFSTLKAKDYPSLSNRCRFKYMDM
jgi:hypothetical protein